MRVRHKTPVLTLVFILAQALSYGIVAFGFVAVWAGWIK